VKSRRAITVLAVSLGLLAGTAIIWWSSADDDPRSDLIGAETSTTTSLPPTTTSTTTTVPPLPALPQRLLIPSLSVDSRVVQVGLEDDGSMEVPAVSDAGWYLHGVRPGHGEGSAVIAAHVDYGGRPGVFFELRRLEVGAEVVVVDEAGDEHRFVVTERFQVDKDELPIPELFRSEGQPVLTLITCGGAFDRGARHYTDNIVVRAAPA
jgi:sortase (surface protein transpeptidase)